MRQKRSFGQIFLNDQKYIGKILDSLDIEGEKVLEIGSGCGAVSGFLAERAKYLYCLEVDERFCDFLRRKFRRKENVEVIFADILKFPFLKLGKDVVIFSNVPYQISSKLIKYLIGYRNHIQKAYLTFQKEFTQKLTAKPGSDSYGFLSCYVQYYAKINRYFDIPNSAFEPKPKVNYSFSEISFYRKPPYKVKNEDFLFKIIRKAFSSRRKKIVNSLPVKGDKHEFFSSLKINLNLRAENVSLKEYVSIANKLYPDRESHRRRKLLKDGVL